MTPRRCKRSPHEFFRSEDPRLIGQSGPGKRVILENAGNQRNGLVIVPPDRADCTGCHSDTAPPFPLHEGVERGLKMRQPMMENIEVRSITIRGFSNNGLFTENVDGFRIIDVESVDNRNHGIFPTLSKNRLVTHSRATGSDTDSGIWVETSENVVVTHNYAADNVNGFEVSNSDDIRLAHNESTNNTLGAAIGDYCVTLDGTPFDCFSDPSITLEFLADQAAENNRVEHNTLVNNGTNPVPHPIGFAAGVFGSEGGCLKKGRRVFRCAARAGRRMPPHGHPPARRRLRRQSGVRASASVRQPLPWWP